MQKWHDFEAETVPMRTMETAPFLHVCKTWAKEPIKTNVGS